MTSTGRTLSWDACYNVRDLGGLATVDGGRVRRGALVRSDTLSRLTGQGRQALLDYGLGTIIDLRHPAEVAADPSVFTGSGTSGDAPVYLNLSLESDDPAAQEAMAGDKTRAEQYSLMLDYFQAPVAEIMQAIAGARPGRVLIHCSAGKDRTGLITALLLSITGVSPRLIAEDYAASEPNLWPLYRQLEAEAAGDPPKLADLRHKIPTAPPETMLDTLAHLDNKYGGPRSYLLAAGLTTETLSRLRARLRE